MDLSSKSPIIDVNDEDKDDEDENCTVEKIEKLKNGAQSKPSAVVRNASSSDLRYPDRVRRTLGETWNNHIIGHGEDKHANVAHLDDPLTLQDTMACDDAHK